MKVANKKMVRKKTVWAWAAIPLLLGLAYFIWSGKWKLGFDRKTTLTPPDREMPAHFQYDVPENLPIIALDSAFEVALHHQANYLLRPTTPNSPTKHLSRQDLLLTIQNLENLTKIDKGSLEKSFDLYRVKTNLKADRVRMTGYYTPVIEIRNGESPEFPTPVFGISKTDSTESDSLGTTGKEKEEILGWVRSVSALTNVQLQGSAFARFEDGSSKLLMYSSSTPHTAEDSASQGASRKIFQFSSVRAPTGGAGVPLTAGYSIAVDPKYIPIGACLLAEIPVMNEKGRVTKHEFRVLFAQDTGGGIKTTGKIDLYGGIGNTGKHATETHNQYGKVWILLPRQPLK